MIVRQFSLEEGDTLMTMAIDLSHDGKATLYLHGTTRMTCEHDQSWLRRFDVEIACTSRVNKEDMDDLELAIRGNEPAASRLGTRTLGQLFAKQPDPCDTRDPEEIIPCP